MATKKTEAPAVQEDTAPEATAETTEEAPAAQAVPAKPVDPSKDKVDFYAFKDNDKYKDDIFVAVNGKTFKIQRGKHVKIPRYVAEVLENSSDQDTATANLIEQESDAYRVASKSLN